jgi:hypothetical protein
VDFTYVRQLMATQAELIRHLVADVSDDQARWKPAPDRWSILEVINHLYDEEREDFREHLTERGYNKRDLAGSVETFLAERRASLAWLEGLSESDWDTSIRAPWDAPIRAGDMLASWAVHDQWHIEQLVRLRRDYTIAQVEPYDVGYAGTL